VVFARARVRRVGAAQVLRRTEQQTEAAADVAGERAHFHTRIAGNGGDHRCSSRSFAGLRRTRLGNDIWLGLYALEAEIDLDRTTADRRLRVGDRYARDEILEPRSCARTASLKNKVRSAKASSWSVYAAQ